MILLWLFTKNIGDYIVHIVNIHKLMLVNRLPLKCVASGVSARNYFSVIDGTGTDSNDKINEISIAN